jgi:hypothetical protein
LLSLAAVLRWITPRQHAGEARGCMRVISVSSRQSHGGLFHEHFARTDWIRLDWKTNGNLSRTIVSESTTIDKAEWQWTTNERLEMSIVR